MEKTGEEKKDIYFLLWLWRLSTIEVLHQCIIETRRAIEAPGRNPLVKPNSA